MADNDKVGSYTAEEEEEVCTYRSIRRCMACADVVLEADAVAAADDAAAVVVVVVVGKLGDKEEKQEDKLRSRSFLRERNRHRCHRPVSPPPCTKDPLSVHIFFRFDFFFFFFF